MAVDQRARIVEKHLLRRSAEVAEGCLHPLQPSRLPLVPEGAHENPPGIAKRRHEQIEPHALAADRRPRLAEIDLQLMPRRRLEAQRRPRLRPQRLAQPPHRPLDRAQAHRQPFLARQVLAHDVGVAAMSAKPLRQPLLKPVELLRPPRVR